MYFNGFATILYPRTPDRLGLVSSPILVTKLYIPPPPPKVWRVRETQRAYKQQVHIAFRMSAIG